MRLVIVGGGLAAAHAVEELRRLGHEHSIDVFGSENHLPYNRPPLSKGVLLGKEDEGSILVHDRRWYSENAVELHLGTKVTELDLEHHEIRAGSNRVGYDRLLICTGSTPRHLGEADRTAGAVAYLRTVEDCRVLRAAFGPGRSILIIGGGWIGLEVAAAARIAGSNVTVVESADLPLLPVLGPEVATVFADLHRAHGVDLRVAAGVESFRATQSGATLVALSDSTELEVDLVVVGIGVEPDDSLAHGAGLPVTNGILVDDRLRTSDPHVYAAGDVANHLHPVLGRRIRVEHWDTAIEQGKVAARNMLDGNDPYTRLPYFFTDQYDLGMEYVGSVGPDGYDQVIVRGDLAGRFTAFWLEQDLVLAGTHVNDWDAIDPIRSIVGSRVEPDLLRDESADLATIGRVVASRSTR